METIDERPRRRPAIAIAAELARAGNGEAGGLIRDLHDENNRLRADNKKLRALLTPCCIVTDAQNDPAYPKTVDDVLHLLSCYWADFLPDDVELGDVYFGAWERQARPVIERIMKPND